MHVRFPVRLFLSLFYSHSRSIIHKYDGWYMHVMFPVRSKLYQASNFYQNFIFSHHSSACVAPVLQSASFFFASRITMSWYQRFQGCSAIPEMRFFCTWITVAESEDYYLLKKCIHQYYMFKIKNYYDNLNIIFYKRTISVLWKRKRNKKRNEITWTWSKIMVYVRSKRKATGSSIRENVDE